MTKKYKLIKEYPGSPKLGTTVDYMSLGKGYGSYLSEGSKLPILKDLVENQPEFWQEIIEKEYEILSLIYKKPDGWLHSFKCNQIVEAKIENGFIKFKTPHKSWDYYSDRNSQESTLEVFAIHSVKRVSDGEVFTVGDKVESELVGQGICIIYGFEIKDNQLKIEHTHFSLLDKRYPGTQYGRHLHLINKCKPLFKSVDGVDIYEGDKVWVYSSVNVQAEKIGFPIILDIASKNYGSLRYKEVQQRSFSTKEATEEYILMNKPCLSINDIITPPNVFETMINVHYTNKLKHLVKSKLC